MRRGGRRRRFIVPGAAAVWVSSGRWDPRRLRVEQCAETLKAELVYRNMICDGVDCAPGWSGTIQWTPNCPSQAWLIDVELKPNPVWGRGASFSDVSNAGSWPPGSMCRSLVLNPGAEAVGA
jgi:hypothetical protein